MGIEKEISDLKSAFAAFIRLRIHEEAEAIIESERRPTCEIFMVEMDLKANKYRDVLNYLE